jgi:hypothetical protein
MNCKGVGRKQSWSNLVLTGISTEDLRATETSVSIGPHHGRDSNQAPSKLLTFQEFASKSYRALCIRTNSKVNKIGTKKKQYVTAVGRRDLTRLPRNTLYPQTSALSSPTSGDCSIGIVRSRIKVTEFEFL